MWGWSDLKTNLFQIKEAPFLSSRYESRTSGWQGSTSETHGKPISLALQPCLAGAPGTSLFHPHNLSDIPWGHWMRLVKNRNLKQAAGQWFTKNRVSLGLQTAQSMCRAQALWPVESQRKGKSWPGSHLQQGKAPRTDTAPFKDFKTVAVNTSPPWLVPAKHKMDIKKIKVQRIRNAGRCRYVGWSIGKTMSIQNTTLLTCSELLRWKRQLLLCSFWGGSHCKALNWPQWGSPH